MIVGFSPAGGADTAARLVAQKLSENLGQPVVVENRPGASGSIATETVAKSRADGYTLLLLTVIGIVQAAMPAKLPYDLDLERDFAPISLLGATRYLLVVHPSVPTRNVKELIALARLQPGTLSYASSGMGSVAHLMAELFNSMAKVKIIQVPYKGSGQYTVAIASGEVHMSFVSLPAVLPLLGAGKIRALAIGSAKRSPLMPSIPTIDESGLPGYDMSGTWFGVVAPAGVPKDIIARLSTVIGKVVNTPEMQESFNKRGIEPQTNTPEQFAAFIHSEIALNTKLIRSIGMKAE
ncbi:MAG: tripartite tricarboxylate transporter substrate binding protein [Betaproteobacteria bacterium]|nr:tripartite tricarboxylate transporter substrate binding protein [Betaproteobacteria bacterium]